MKNVFHLNEKELNRFVSEPKEQVMTENYVRVLVQVDAPYFKKGRKWRVSYNGQPIMVTVLDEKFLDRVERNEETFCTGDVLDCELTIKQVLKDGNIVPMYELTEVKEHRFSPYPNPLF